MVSKGKEANGVTAPATSQPIGQAHQVWVWLLLCLALVPPCCAYLAVVAPQVAHVLAGVGVVDGDGGTVDSGEVLTARREAALAAALDAQLFYKLHVGKSMGCT